MRMSLNRLYLLFFIILSVMLSSVTMSAQAKPTYKLMKWDDLLPKSDLKALMEAPVSKRILEGSLEDTIDSPLSMSLKNPKGAYEKALVSSKIVKKLNGKKVKLPGFIVPIDLMGEGKTKAFFFVPFFGACLHLPPPPPNQIIYATYKKGYFVKDMNQPYYIEATLSTKKIKNDMATAAYSAKVNKIYLYTE